MGLRPIPPTNFDHLGIDPHIDPENINSQVMYQIEVYQAIRDYAQDESNFWKGRMGAVSVYALLGLYALLGAFCLYSKL
jgi:hypothetical protein